MHIPDLKDTIGAISTPPGMGAIAMVRLSGGSAVDVCNEIFLAPGKHASLQDLPSHTLHFGSIADGEEIIDEVVLSLFRAPHSYTGEDVVEISCHGSVYIQQRILGLLISKGIRMASPGEFTLRAFLNRKMDLSQAEAVADLIASHSETAHDVAMRQMRGGFSEKIRHLRDRLVEFTSLIELELDFAEEDVEFASRPDLVNLLVEMTTEITLLINSFALGNVIKNGIPVAIIGKPNVGKSTLLNAILNEEKAIVSEIPGTTRDAIEDTIIIGGFSFRFIDTAGLRAATDSIESMGIGRTWEKINEAAVILYVFDVTASAFPEVMDAVAEVKDAAGDPQKRIILIGNKTDQLGELPHGFRDFVEFETIFVSAKRRENIHLIAESLMKSVHSEGLTTDTVITNARHLGALRAALSSIEAVSQGLASGISPDLLTVDIRNALHHLGEITGEITSDEILGNIFGKFCIGK
jgi:tRNA modification GTPase